MCDEHVRVCFRSIDHPVDDTENCPLLEIEIIGGFSNPRGLTLNTIAEPWPGVSSTCNTY
jgi:hypothetical protein